MTTGDQEGYRDPSRMLSPGDSMRCARQVKATNPQGWISAREHNQGMMLVEWGRTCYTAEAWLEYKRMLQQDALAREFPMTPELQQGLSVWTRIADRLPAGLVDKLVGLDDPGDGDSG